MTSYFFQHKYCQCEKKRQHNLRLSKQPTSKAKTAPVCSRCGKSRPDELKAGSFTAYLFKELRCTCSKPKIENEAKQNRRTQTSVRINQKRQLAKARGAQIANSGQKAAPIGRGTVIGGTFEVEAIIGQGGMGVVYLARHKTMQQKYALKVLAPNLISEQYWLRFQAEAKTLASLKHPSMVNVYDLGIHQNNVFYYAMDYLQGHNLEDILAREGPQSLERTLDIFIAVLDGLTYAHRNGIVHRDIKPANIFICSKSTSDASEVKILDFGIAKMIKADSGRQGLTDVGEVFGSPFYMSPEQCSGQTIDIRSDIYSVGCSIFETLSGFVPFEASSSVEIALMHEEDEPPKVSDLVGNTLPESVDLVIAKCMAKLPNERYKSAKELALDLEKIRDGKSVSVKESTKRSLEIDDQAEDQSNPLLQIVIIFIGVIAFSLAGIFIWQSSFVQKESKSLHNHEDLFDSKVDLALAPGQQSNLQVPTISESKPEFPNKIKAFLKSNPGKYSSIIKSSRGESKIYNFPGDFSLGVMQLTGNGKSLEATGKIDAAPYDKIMLEANSNVSEFPELLKYFREYEVVLLSLSCEECSYPLMNENK